jgi:hypothetical protein
MSQKGTVEVAQCAPTAWSAYVTIVVWTVAVIAGWTALGRYQFSANDSSGSKHVDHWPPESRLPRTLEHSTLIVFLHPKCPCSRASLTELERLFTSVQGRTDGEINCVVDATIPENASGDWLDTDTLNRAKNLPNARVIADRGGAEAAAFGATTSGFVMLFNEQGTCQFAGGVTESRGHEGENVGLDALQRVLCNEINTTQSFPVFGCRLCLPESNQKSNAALRVGAT